MEGSDGRSKKGDDGNAEGGVDEDNGECIINHNEMETWITKIGIMGRMRK